MAQPITPLEGGATDASFSPAVAFGRRRVVLALLLIGVSSWVVWNFLPALVWAAVLALATWPLFERLRHALGEGRPSTGAAVIMTLGAAVALVVPLALLFFEAGRETLRLIPVMEAIEQSGLALPVWVKGLPYIGESLADWWNENLADPNAFPDLLGRVNTTVLVGWARSLGTQVLHRATILFFTLLTLFFLYRDGESFARESETLIGRVFGPQGQRVGHHMLAAVRGTVNGLVLVGLGEGAVLGVAYAFAGLPHPVLLGAATGVVAAIPFGAPIVFGAAAVYLLSIGHTGAAAGLLAFGLVVLAVADHAIRPFLIGSAARLPFLWVLLGIFGGLETFGLVGLFVGPAVMAATVALWREWVEAPPEPAMLQAAGPRPAALPY